MLLTCCVRCSRASGRRAGLVQTGFSHSWMLLFSSVYFGIDLYHIVVSMLLFFFFFNGFFQTRWVLLLVAPFFAELLILLPCNNESYLLQIQKPLVFLCFFLSFSEYFQILPTSIWDQICVTKVTRELF